jgi:acetolactate decarboxylase
VKTIRCSVPGSLYEALEQRMSADRASCNEVIAAALSRYLDAPLHTLFQVSTSAALVGGLYEGAVEVSRLLRHGDFGLGTFVDLAGEMVVLDGTCYQVSPDGVVRTVEGDTLIPYAVVTHFSTENSIDRRQLASFDDLVSACDALRDSNNLFYAFRIDGHFTSVKTRVMKAVEEGIGLKSARRHVVARVRWLVQRTGLPLSLPLKRSSARWPRARVPCENRQNFKLQDERDAGFSAGDTSVSAG